MKKDHEIVTLASNLIRCADWNAVDQAFATEVYSKVQALDLFTFHDLMKEVLSSVREAECEQTLESIRREVAGRASRDDEKATFGDDGGDFTIDARPPEKPPLRVVTDDEVRS